MPDLTPQFEHAHLEADMERLAAEVKKNQENPEMRGASGQELIKQALKSVGPTPATAALQADDTAQSPLPDYAQSASPEVKLEIEYLIDIAIHHGVMKANASAAKSSPFVLDAFHDALAGKLYPVFQKKGIVK